MGYRAASSNRLAWGLALRAVSIGGLAYLAAFLITATALYATTSIVVALLLVLSADIVRTLKRSQRLAMHSPPVGDARPVDEHGALHPGHRHVEYLQTLLDTVAAALIVVAPNGGIRFVNRAAHSLFKGSVSQLRDLAEFDAAAARTLLSLAPGARQIIQFTDGRRLLCVAAQFSAPGYAPERLISLQRIAGELDAVEIEAWQDMARVIAHEMMNSLTPIASLSESLEALLRSQARSSAVAPISDDVAQSLEAINRRSLGLMSFIERYRAVADLPPPVLRPIQAARLVADIEKLMSADFEERKVRLTTRVDPPEITLTADPALLEQAVINLLQNAAEATEHTLDPRVDLECKLDAGQILITVSDNGVGLPQNERERILLPFYSTKPNGSGIGLALVRHIALAHQGKLDVRANDPHGAIFSLVLPMSDLQRPR